MFELRKGLTFGKVVIIGNSQALTGSDGVTREVEWGHHASSRPRVILYQRTLLLQSWGHQTGGLEEDLHTLEHTAAVSPLWQSAF